MAGIPPSVAKLSLEELQKLSVELLKKLKVRGVAADCPTVHRVFVFVGRLDRVTSCNPGSLLLCRYEIGRLRS